MSDNDFFEGVKILARGGRAIGKDTYRGSKQIWKLGKKAYARRPRRKVQTEKLL